MATYAVIALSAGLLCGAPVSRARDMAAPGMPNVDVKSMGSGKLAGYQKAILTFALLLMAESFIVLIDNAEKAGQMTSGELVAQELAMIPSRR